MGKLDGGIQGGAVNSLTYTVTTTDFPGACAESAFHFLDATTDEDRRHNAQERLRQALHWKEKFFDATPWRKASALWFQTVNTDWVACALFSGHYSCRHTMPRTVSGPGEDLTLIRRDALVVWRREKFRKDGQTGVNCAVFRNIGDCVSSVLLADAMALAWAKWPGARLFTFVDADKVASVNPGYCFKKAGWRVCGKSRAGLLILEALPHGTEGGRHAR